jgi:hypothetical protein
MAQERHADLRRIENRQIGHPVEAHGRVQIAQTSGCGDRERSAEAQAEQADA